ncbi:ATPase, T2SS/T4P/T4SS family, partial [Escherichia coli]
MFFSDADYPGKDISDVVYVSISEKDDKPVHVYIADNSKGQRAVQAYIGTLNVKYPGKVNITWTTLDVIASRYQDSERSSDSNSSQHLNSNQEKVISYLAKANNLGSSDLHITPGRDGSEFTYVEARVHGELEILDVIPRKEGLELLGAAYSGMSDVIKGTQFDPAIPQDARIAENFLKPVNLFGARYSHYPCVGGVYAVFRLIKDDSKDIPTFEELGYMPQQIQTIRRMLQRPEGIIVLSGPTGSGKSTTLRTASEAYLSTFGFNHNDNMRLPRKRLFTIESPPEGRIPGAIQTAVRDSVDGWV